MPDDTFYDLPKTTAMNAYSEALQKNHQFTLTEHFLYAILAQLDKISHQLDELTEKEEEI